MVNLYEALGVSRFATKTEIKTAYRKLAKIYHPDANGGDEKAEEKFKEICNAYEVLFNDLSRREYDKDPVKKTDFEDNSVDDEYYDLKERKIKSKMFVTKIILIFVFFIITLKISIILFLFMIRNDDSTLSRGVRSMVLDLQEKKEERELIEDKPEKSSFLDIFKFENLLNFNFNKEEKSTVFEKDGKKIEIIKNKSKTKSGKDIIVNN